MQKPKAGHSPPKRQILDEYLDCISSSLLTPDQQEPQIASDKSSFYQSALHGICVTVPTVILINLNTS
jgi:hypothetical protein